MGMPSMLQQNGGYSDGLPAIRSRANSLMQQGQNHPENRRSMSSLDHITSSRNSFDESSGYQTPTTLPPNFGQSLSSYALQSSQPGQNAQYAQNYGYSAPPSLPEYHTDQSVKSEDHSNMMYNRNNGADMASNSENNLSWSQSYQPSEPSQFMYTSNSAQSAGPAKTETDMMSNSIPTPGGHTPDGMFGGIYTNTSSFSGGHIFDTWDMGQPWENKTNALLSFCFPEGYARSEIDLHNESRLRSILTADNVKHFVECFWNWEAHWPTTHRSTFNPVHADHSLVLAMICVGAVYSDRMIVNDVRWLMELVKAAMYRSSHLLNLSNGQRYGSDDYGLATKSVEEIQALLLLQALFTWHGNQAQRHQARGEFWRVAVAARHSGIFNSARQGDPLFSILHQPGPVPDRQELQSWTWESWVEQEKRARVVFLIYLLDAALVMFFNCPPQLDAKEIGWTLPADDAAWEANNASECADALGINGGPAQVNNITGDRRLKQVDFRTALGALSNPSQAHAFQQGMTNIYSKFILIHALHVNIWIAQRQAPSAAGLNNYGGFGSSGPSTPISQHEWIENNSSGHATPTEGAQGQYAHGHHQMLRAINSALGRWKYVWDLDVSVQYPYSQISKREGFCRDGIHFFHLAQQFIASTRPSDWSLPSDARFTQVMALLKRIKTSVRQNQEVRGLATGSIGQLDDNYGDESYGIKDLTLDMKLLFVPLSR